MNTSTQKIPKNIFGFISIVIGIIALNLAIFQGKIARFYQEVPAESRLERGLDWISGKSSKSEKAASRNASLIYMTVGSVAALFAILSFIYKENLRLSIVSGSLSLIAVAWTSVLLGVVIFIILILFWSFSFS